MKRHKVLIVTPIPLEPEVEGNRRRIKVLASELVELGADVHVALLPLKPLPHEDVSLMRTAWGKRFHLFPPKYPSLPVARAVNKAQRLCYSALSRISNGRHSSFEWTGVDNYYFQGWTARLRLLQIIEKYDVVLAEYIFMSRAFAAFGSDVLKVIDTHDVFADRNSRMSASGLSYKWWSVTEAEEADAVRRADAVIAIEAGEAEQFRRYTPQPVYCLPHVPALVDLPVERAEANKLLIVASGNPINVQGVRRFITQVYPKVRAAEPNVSLSLVGNVCGSVGDLAVSHSGIKLLGRVQSLTGPYAAADVVINPVQVGTGLCIKSVEAMAHGRPLVSTASGARGIAAGAGVVVADDPAAMADSIVHLLRSPADRQAAAAAGLAYLRQLKEANQTLLMTLLETKAKPTRVGLQQALAVT